MTSIQARLPAILLFGTLSVFFAEVLSGASNLWFVDPWGLLMVYPLYLGHALFFINLAIRTKRTTLHHLYFWGMLFALYEALITKVLWFGFPEASGAILPEIQGIAVMEFTILTFFWHPIMSFIIPILVYELLSHDILPGHERYLTRNKTTLLLIILLTIIGASFQSNGVNYNLFIALGSIIGTLLIIYIFNLLSTKKDILSLILGKKSMTVLIIYLTSLYVITTAVIFPERLPQTPLPYLFILGWYLILIFLLWIDTSQDNQKPSKHFLINRNYVLLFISLIILLTMLFCSFPPIGQLLLMTLFLGITLFGILILLGSLASLLQNKRIKKKNTIIK